MKNKTELIIRENCIPQQHQSPPVQYKAKKYNKWDSRALHNNKTIYKNETCAETLIQIDIEIVIAIDLEIYTRNCFLFNGIAYVLNIRPV